MPNGHSKRPSSRGRQFAERKSKTINWLNGNVASYPRNVVCGVKLSIGQYTLGRGAPGVRTEGGWRHQAGAGPAGGQPGGGDSPARRKVSSVNFRWTYVITETLRSIQK